MVDIFDKTLENVEIKLDQNKLSQGDEVNLMAKDPTLKRILVGVGWDNNAFDSDVADLDLSCFMLNRHRKTRVNEDFIFYNNLEGSDKAVIHNGDNRTGAGDGDDESLTINLQSIHFDIYQLMFVLSIYKGEEKGHNFTKLRNTYIRIVNMDTNMEIVRFELSKLCEDRAETGMFAACLNREGPKWHFVAMAEFIEGGLPKIAEDFDIIVQAS